MSPNFLALTAMVLMMTATGEALPQSVRVPPAFQGRWASSPAQCGVVHEGALTITAAEVAFYASRGKVQSVRVLAPREIEVELESRGEGEVWRNKVRLLLSQDGQRLTDGTRNPKLTRVRCK
jgi:hypothetical protein